MDKYTGMPWYAGKISRQDADQAVLKGSQGDFIVRESATVKGSLTLVCKSGPAAVRNDRIMVLANGRFQLDGTPHTYASLPEMFAKISFMAKRPALFLLDDRIHPGRAGADGPGGGGGGAMRPNNSASGLISIESGPGCSGDGASGGGGGASGPPQPRAGSVIANRVKIAARPSVGKKSFLGGTLERNGALKHPNVVNRRGHAFLPHSFIKPTACSHCHGRMFGLSNKTGAKCAECGFSCHTKCWDFVHFDCPGTSEYDPTESLSSKCPHSWATHTYLSPTFCGMCGGMLFGLRKQGKQCGECKMNVHKKCMASVPDTCGTDFTERFGRIYCKITVTPLPQPVPNCPQLYRIALEVGNGANLMAADPNGFSDPYLRCEITPDKEKLTKKKGEIHKKTLNPHFNATFTWDVIEYHFEDGSDYTLEVQLWDWDLIGSNDFLGAMAFPLPFLGHNAMAVDGGKEGWFKLLDKKQGRHYHSIILDGTGGSRSTGIDVAAMSRFHSGGAGGQDGQARAVGSRVLQQPVGRGPPNATERFELKNVLGKGSFGKVFLATDRHTGDTVAIKALAKKVVIMNSDVDDTFTERDVLCLAATKGPCEFIAQLILTYQTPGQLFFVMEFISGGDLMFHIQEAGSWDLKKTTFYSAECISALWFLHRNGVIYRDLKLDNILLTQAGHLKLADFGMSKQGMLPGMLTRTFCGTPDYIAPEILDRKPYDKAVDFWAMGVMVYEMLTGEAPFNGYDDSDLFHSILHQRVECPRSMNMSTKQFVIGLLNRDVAARIGSGPAAEREIKDHSFFQSINWPVLQAGNQPPPYKPKGKPGDKNPTRNFEKTFTTQTARLSIVPQADIDLIDQALFKHFESTSTAHADASA